MALPPPSFDERFFLTLHRFKEVMDAAIYATILRSAHRSKMTQWNRRVADVLDCPDAAKITPVAGAGEVRDGVQIMHNGIRILKGSYYRWRGTHMFRITKGVHEPQEERVFGEVLKFMKSGAVMLELGAYWGFYSLWFAGAVKGARCILVEPRKVNLHLGRANFRLNGHKAEFVQAGVGAKSGERTRSLGAMVCVDDLVEQRGLDKIDILHCDIQGYEGDMLKGAVRTLGARKVRFIFVSTHSQALHTECRARLKGFGFEIIADADLDGTYNFDGILVGQLPGIDGPGPVAISQRPASRTRD